MDDVSFMFAVLTSRPLAHEVSKTHSYLEGETGQAGGKDGLEKPFRLVAIFYVILAIFHSFLSDFLVRINLFVFPYRRASMQPRL